jgi:hypothetical protein
MSKVSDWQMGIDEYVEGLIDQGYVWSLILHQVRKIYGIHAVDYVAAKLKAM